MTVQADVFPFLRSDTPPADEWLPFLRESYATGRHANFGPNVQALETECAALVGRSCCVVANATAGLAASLMALGRPGPVVLSPFTFPATAQAILLAGCVPVFAEVDPITWELDADAVQTALGGTQAVAVVHTRVFGLCRDIKKVEAVCEAFSTPLLVDSAAAWGGSTPDGRLVGLAGDSEIFSFHATKTAAIGEGGLVVGDRERIDRVRQAINFSIVGDDVVGRGMNGKLDEFAAARARAMLRKLPTSVALRTRFVEAAYHGAAETADLTHPSSVGRPPWQTYPIKARDGCHRTRLREELARRGVETRPYYTPALHRTTAFRAGVELPVAEELSDTVLCLPVYTTDESYVPAELGRRLSNALEAVG